MIESIAAQNKAGAKIRLCLTPDVVQILGDSLWLSMIRVPVLLWRAVIICRRTSGIPLQHKAFYSAVLSTESDANLTLRK